MKIKAFLKIQKDYRGTTTLSVSKLKPNVANNEVVTLLNFDIPDELFDRPTLEANIIVKAPPATAIPTVTIESMALVDWIDKK